MHLSTLERKILNLIQEDIPLSPQPFKILSQRLGIKEEELLGRIKQLQDKGIIHSFAAHLNHKKVGFKSTLLALKVPLNKLEEIAHKISHYPEVTHCILRKDKYNIWVVFIYKKEAKLKGFLDKLEKEMGRQNILNLPTKRQFKLKTRLRV